MVLLKLMALLSTLTFVLAAAAFVLVWAQGKTIRRLQTQHAQMAELIQQLTQIQELHKGLSEGKFAAVIRSLEHHEKLLALQENVTEKFVHEHSKHVTLCEASLGTMRRVRQTLENLSGQFMNALTLPAAEHSTPDTLRSEKYRTALIEFAKAKGATETQIAQLLIQVED